jgi:anthranilate phosphoribosyltransferase
MAERMVATLVELGSERALVFFGHDGLDELTTTTTSAVWEVIGGEVRFSNLDPTELGVPLAVPEDLVGGDPATNAELARAVLDGERGPRRDIVVLNAGAALVAAGIVDDLAAGIEAAVASLDAGRAAAALDLLVKVSQEAAEEEAG